MHSKVRRSSVALFLAISATPLLLGVLSGPAGAQDTTTTAPVTTTTLAPTTTVPPTTAPTTTTTLPATTTTRARPTTTTSSSTTTTTVAKSASSSKAWGWVLLAVVIALAAILVGLLIARTRRQGREVDWERSVVPAVTAAELARELILSQTSVDDASIEPQSVCRSTTRSKVSNGPRRRHLTKRIGRSACAAPTACAALRSLSRQTT